MSMVRRPEGFWDGFADSYSTFHQGDVPGRIVDRLFDLGMLKPTDSVLEVAAGTGAYSLELAPRVRILTCMDSSQRMLDILFSRVRETGHGNVERFHQDWEEYVPRKGYCACVMALCPGSDRPESIQRMEGAARETCAVVTWMVNHHDDLEMRVWDELGMERPGISRGSDAVAEWLEANGRSPHVEDFDAHVETLVPLEKRVESIQRMFGAMGVREDVGGIARSILEPGSEDGMCRISEDNSLRLTCWRVPSER